MHLTLDTLGQAESGLGNHDSAAEALARAVKLSPNNSPLCARLGEYLYNAGRLVEAESVLRRSINLSGRFRAFVTLARLLHDQNKRDEAISLLRSTEHVEKNRLDQRALIRDKLYELFGEAGMPKKQRDLEGPLVAALHARAQLFSQKHDWKRLREIYERILQIDPADKKAIRGLKDPRLNR